MMKISHNPAFKQRPKDIDTRGMNQTANILVTLWLTDSSDSLSSSLDSGASSSAIKKLVAIVLRTNYQESPAVFSILGDNHAYATIARSATLFAV